MKEKVKFKDVVSFEDVCGQVRSLRISVVNSDHSLVEIANSGGDTEADPFELSAPVS